jgi:hypothetical protein
VCRTSLSRRLLLPTVLSTEGVAIASFSPRSLHSSEVFLAGVASGARALLDFSEDMKQHDDAHVQEGENQDCLRGYL